MNIREMSDFALANIITDPAMLGVIIRRDYGYDAHPYKLTIAVEAATHKPIAWQNVEQST